MNVQTSHLTTLVNRFLATLNDIKHWNQIDSLKGEPKLRHHVINIIEYIFFHSQATGYRGKLRNSYIYSKKGEIKHDHK